MARWLVVGISGVTGGGKSSLANRLHRNIPSHHITQDNYFYPRDSSHHIPAPGCTNYHNWDVITCIDMERMMKDIKTVIGSSPLQYMNSPPPPLDINKPLSSTAVLIVDGFLLFTHKELWELCDLRYFLTLPKEVCWERRQCRQYDPPDPAGYFDLCVWPEYERHLDCVQKLDGITFLEGVKSLDHSYKLIYDEIILTI
ncbi:nicotinamide riboside kinase 2-like [Homarus americanus]|nr:nicotinamide riboside kinase 2-like [Homarus americanus]XP_042218078.1 nicotinamide riboside kinase 2-like [Homarus americanus]XP_042218079.1 nicotinamide riboside kinase 2-like [Homarus americanus]